MSRRSRRPLPPASPENVLPEFPEDTPLTAGMEVIRTDFDLAAALASSPFVPPRNGRRPVNKLPIVDLASSMANNPFAPPRNGRCPVNELPNELLSHIFHLGSFDSDEDADEDDDDGWEDEDDYSLDHDFGMDEDDEEDGSRDKPPRKDGGPRPLPSPDEDNEGDGSRDKPPRRDSGPESLPSPDADDEEEEVAELPFQILVSHVCRHWRSVALDNPALWTSIRVSSISGLQPPFSRAEAFLARSKNLPIDIDIDCALDDVEDDDEDEPKQVSVTTADLEQFLALITPHVERWRALEVMVEDYTFMHTVLSALAAQPAAQALELLQLYHYDDLDDNDEYDTFEPRGLRASTLPFGGAAPKLAHVALWGVHIDWTRAVQTSLLTGLSDLELAYHAKDVRPSFTELTGILRGSPGLTTLTFCFSGPAGEPSDWDPLDLPPTVLDLPALENLVLAYLTPSYLSGLLLRLTFPALTSLALDFDGGDFSAIARQLAAPAPNRTTSLLAGLEHLKIGGLPCDPGAVDVMYGQLGGLKTLNLACGFMDKAFYERLCVPTTAAVVSSGREGTYVKGTVPMYCPQLTTLTTSGVGGDEMRRLVEARAAAGCPLSRVFMSADDEVDEKQEAWLRERVTFSYFEPSDEEDDDDIDMEVDDL